MYVSNIGNITGQFIRSIFSEFHYFHTKASTNAGVMWSFKLTFEALPEIRNNYFVTSGTDRHWIEQLVADYFFNSSI